MKCVIGDVSWKKNKNLPLFFDISTVYGYLMKSPRTTSVRHLPVASCELSIAQYVTYDQFSAWLSHPMVQAKEKENCFCCR